MIIKVGDPKRKEPQMATDPEQPATCIPPDPSVSGWWYLQDGEFIVNEYWNAEGGTWDEFFVDRPISCAEWAHASGYRILGPVPTFAEVEALRTSCLSAGESVRIWADRTLKAVDELKTAEAEVEALQAELTVANVKLKMLRSEVTNMSAMRDGDAYVLRQFADKFTAAPKFGEAE